MFRPAIHSMPAGKAWDSRPHGKAYRYEPVARPMYRMTSGDVEHKEVTDDAHHTRVYRPLIARSEFLGANNINLGKRAEALPETVVCGYARGPLPYKPLPFQAREVPCTRE